MGFWGLMEDMLVGQTGNNAETSTVSYPYIGFFSRGQEYHFMTIGILISILIPPETNSCFFRFERAWLRGACVSRVDKLGMDDPVLTFTIPA
jgi:hypothetical protein